MSLLFCWGVDSALELQFILFLLRLNKTLKEKPMKPTSLGFFA